MSYTNLGDPLVQEFTQAKVESWCIEDGSDILANRVLEDNLPKAVTLNILQKETSSDKELQSLAHMLQTHNVTGRKKPYAGIFEELCVVNGIIMRSYVLLMALSCLEKKSLFHTLWEPMYVGWLMKVIKAQTKHYDCWDNGEIAAFAPQEAYTCFTADYKNKLSSLMRTIPGISKQLRRLDRPSSFLR